ncbi:Uncharacterised protein at_DN0948, partial [Pycnogonum litorale]
MEEVELLHSEGGEHKNNNGLTTWQAAIVIAGVTFGTGILILPHDIQIAGAYGLFLAFTVPIILFYGVNMLSKCWTLAVQIAQPIDPETKIQISRSPYPFIGFICYGKYVRLLELIALTLTVVSLCLVFTVFANGTTNEASTALTYRNISSKTITLTFSSVVYMYSIASIVPSIQADMKNPEKFTYSLVAGVSVLYVGISSLGIVSYFKNPPNVNKNVLLSLQSGSVRYTAFSLMAFHLLFTCVLFMNPVNQEFEDLLRIEPKFGLKKLFLRTVIGIVFVFVCESIPRFDVLISLVTGLTVNLFAIILPTIFYNKLVSYTRSTSDQILNQSVRKISIYERMLMVIMVIVFSLSSCSSIYYSWLDIMKPSSFEAPCY